MQGVRICGSRRLREIECACATLNFVCVGMMTALVNTFVVVVILAKLRECHQWEEIVLE